MLNNFPFKFIGVKSNSTDKPNKIKSKFGQYNNYSKHYCITLNQYAQYKQDYLSLNSQSNSKNKNSNRNKISRPSTAPQKNKNHQKKKNNVGNEHKNNFVGFNGIVNIRTNLIANNKNNGLNTNKKYKIKDNNKNNGFSTLFNPSNAFTNNILMNTSIGFNNKLMKNMGNNNGHSRTLFGNNNKRITSPRIFINQPGFKTKKQNNGTKIRLSSAITNNNIPLVNNNSTKKKRKL